MFLEFFLTAQIVKLSEENFRFLVNFSWHLNIVLTSHTVVPVSKGLLYPGRLRPTAVVATAMTS